MFGMGRGFAAKAANEPRLRCTELDGNGNVTLVSGEFKKSELIAKVCTRRFGGIAMLKPDLLLNSWFSSMDSCLEISGRSTPPFYHTSWSDIAPFSSAFST
jgi:hypothetical protein